MTQYILDAFRNILATDPLKKKITMTIEERKALCEDYKNIGMVNAAILVKCECADLVYDAMCFNPKTITSSWKAEEHARQTAAKIAKRITDRVAE